MVYIRKSHLVLSLTLSFAVMVALPVFAQTAAATAHQPSLGELLNRMLPMFVVIVLVFHFMIIRPQKQKDQAHSELIKGIKNGESVVTSSGIIGRVAGVAPGYVTLEIAQGVKVRFENAHIVKREEIKKEDAAKK